MNKEDKLAYVHDDNKMASGMHLSGLPIETQDWKGEELDVELVENNKNVHDEVEQPVAATSMARKDSPEESETPLCRVCEQLKEGC